MSGEEGCMRKTVEKLIGKYEKYRAEHGYTCDCCGREIFTYPTRRLCADCDEALPRILEEERCPKCGRKRAAQGVCLDCKARMPSFYYAISPFSYDDEAAVLINRLKNGDKYLVYFFADAIAPLLRKKLKESGFDEAECVYTCVPDRKEGRLARRTRSYNPAAELARLTCERLNAAFDENVMVKARETRPQKRMSATERFENVRGAYRVHERVACRDKIVVVFDDIMTTGATGGECARILLAAGAKCVVFVSAVSVSERRDFPTFAE